MRPSLLPVVFLGMISAACATTTRSASGESGSASPARDPVRARDAWMLVAIAAAEQALGACERTSTIVEAIARTDPEDLERERAERTCDDERASQRWWDVADAAFDAAADESLGAASAGARSIESSELTPEVVAAIAHARGDLRADPPFGRDLPLREEWAGLAELVESSVLFHRSQCAAAAPAASVCVDAGAAVQRVLIRAVAELLVAIRSRDAAWAQEVLDATSALAPLTRGGAATAALGLEVDVPVGFGPGGFDLGGPRDENRGPWWRFEHESIVVAVRPIDRDFASAACLDAVAVLGAFGVDVEWSGPTTPPR